MSKNDEGKQIVDNSEMDCPQWMSDELVKRTINHFQPKNPEYGEDEAIKILLSLGQLLEATGMLKLEIDDEEKEVRCVGTSEQS